MKTNQWKTIFTVDSEDKNKQDGCKTQLDFAKRSQSLQKFSIYENFNRFMFLEFGFN